MLTHLQHCLCERDIECEQVIVTTAGRIIMKDFNKSGTNINELEGLALHMALQEPVCAHRIVKYFGDNTAVLHTFMSTHSKSFTLNVIIGRIIGRLQLLKSRIIPCYVSTDINPADPLTRNRHLSDDHYVTIALLTNSKLSEGGGLGRVATLDR